MKTSDVLFGILFALLMVATVIAVAIGIVFMFLAISGCSPPPQTKPVVHNWPEPGNPDFEEVRQKPQPAEPVASPPAVKPVVDKETEQLNRDLLRAQELQDELAATSDLLDQHDKSLPDINTPTFKGMSVQAQRAALMKWKEDRDVLERKGLEISAKLRVIRRRLEKY